MTDAPRINGKDYERVGGITVPTPQPGVAFDALPRTFISAVFTIEGGGLPEGEKVTLEMHRTELQQPGQFTFDLFEEEQDYLAEDGYLDKQMPQRVSLNLELGIPADFDSRVYTVRLPDGTELGD